jgi:predicted DNA-binding transcriptional regulator YafY
MRGANLVKLIKTIDLLSSHRGATPDQIAEKLEVSKRTAYRLLSVVEDLGFLIEDIRDPIENRTRKRLDREFHQKIGPINLPDIKFTPSELIGLYLIRGEARAYKGSGLAKNLDSAFAKIGMFAPPGLVEKLDKLQSIFLLGGKMAKSLAGKEEIIDHLADAMLANQTCHIDYHSFHDDRDKSFKIDPLHFFEHQGGLYLFVNTTDYGDIRVLAVERIKGITLTEAIFSYPADFDPDEKLQHAFGLFYDDPLEVEVHFSAAQARYIRERVWAVDQQLIDQEDGSVILKMKTSGRYEIKKWILGYGADAELLQPSGLRAEIKGELARLAALY